VNITAVDQFIARSEGRSTGGCVRHWRSAEGHGRYDCEIDQRCRRYDCELHAP
jgi:hypothetical protein